MFGHVSNGDHRLRNDIERPSAHPILLTPELEAFSLSGFAKT